MATQSGAILQRLIIQLHERFPSISMTRSTKKGEKETREWNDDHHHYHVQIGCHDHNK
jgi:hypothetical protein